MKLDRVRNFGEGFHCVASIERECTVLTYHEFGANNKRVILLIHPAVVMWDYFEYVVPLLEKDFHLIIPALPGYDSDRDGDFTSIEEIAASIERWLKDKEIPEVECVYGCSMGGAVVAKLLSNNVIHFKHAVMDGGITPYRLPWLITRLIAIKDFLMISMGKLGGIKLLEKAFSTDELSEDDIRYEAKVLDMISYRTIWRTFDSANNYTMPKQIVTDCPYIEYWFADAEEKDRRWDIAYIRKAFPASRFLRYRNAGHGGLAPFHPEKLVRGIRILCNKTDSNVNKAYSTEVSNKRKFSLKYRILLKLCRVFKLQRVMELPPEKAQKLFRKAYKGVVIPKITAPGINMRTKKINGSICLWYKHNKPNKRACIYLIGGGMLKYPKSSQAKEVLSLAGELDIDFVLPYYPLVHTGHTLPDVYEMIYSLYKEMLTEYEPENIYFLGGSSGANLSLGLISYINDKGEGLPMPGKVYAGSPGSLLITDEEKKKADRLDKTDVIMSQKATLSVWEGMTGGKRVADYMESLQLGNYTGLKDVYLSFGGDEVFTAAAESIKKRLEQFGVHVTMEIEPGLYHTYAVIPLVKDAMPGYRRMKEYIKR